MGNRSEVPYGTLDLMVLKTLDTLGPQHGYGIARRIEQVAQGSLALNQGTIYPALLRLEHKGWIGGRVGRQREQPQGPFLLHYSRRPQTAFRGGRELGTHRRHDGAPAGEPGVTSLNPIDALR